MPCDLTLLLLQGELLVVALVLVCLPQHGGYKAAGPKTQRKAVCQVQTQAWVHEKIRLRTLG